MERVHPPPQLRVVYHSIKRHREPATPTRIANARPNRLVTELLSSFEIPNYFSIRSIIFLSQSTDNMASNATSWSWLLTPDQPTVDHFYARLPTYSLWTSVAVFSALFLHAVDKYTAHTINPDLPVAGKRWRWEPGFITRYRFLLYGWEIVRDALENVRPPSTRSSWLVACSCC